MRFFVGLGRPGQAAHFDRCLISVRTLARRKSDFPAREWIMDSGAFTQVTRDGGFHEPAAAYAEQIARWRRCGQLVAAVAQDYMCEPAALARTGLTVREHQALTIARYDELRDAAPDAPILPVLQGYRPEDYARHVRDYGRRLEHGAWVGVGSVCKRNGRPAEIIAVLTAILETRPDLRLHGFGVKLNSLKDARVRGMLWSADSMAWSFRAWREGRDPNDVREAAAYCAEVAAAARLPRQLCLV